MIFSSKAPLRIGLAGGGTDVSPYSDMFGGAVVNAAISLYANAVIELTNEHSIVVEATDRNEKQVFDLRNNLPIDGTLDLLKGVYNRIQKDHPFPLKGFRLTTAVDAPAGSGLGTSSTLVVAVLGAFKQMLQLPMDNYQLAHYAYDIERSDLQLAGGKQDQYAAVFGGINFMEFKTTGNVMVTTLQISQDCIQELQDNLLLYFTNSSRESAAIINEQVNNVYNNNQQSVEAMHHLKEQAVWMKTALLQHNNNEIGRLLDYGFTQKRLMAHNISNPQIESIYNAAKKAGATGGKISGAGGGGFMTFYCPGNTRTAVTAALSSFGGYVKPYHFVQQGLITQTLS
ncbi:GHMP family kinase ATP-binding protein [Ferruginibacter sp.]